MGIFAVTKNNELHIFGNIAMKIIAAAFVALSAVVPLAHADSTVDYVRIACMTDIHLLDIEYRTIHYSSSTPLYGEATASGKDAWSNNGFFAPNNLERQCVFPWSKFRIVTTQKEASASGRCGASPEIKLSLYLDDKALVKNAIFGDSCSENHSITRISVRDGMNNGKPHEVEICFKNGQNNISRCELFFQDIEQSWAIFPFDQKIIDSRIKKSF